MTEDYDDDTETRWSIQEEIALDKIAAEERGEVEECWRCGGRQMLGPDRPCPEC